VTRLGITGKLKLTLLEAETRFRKVQGYGGLASLAVKIEQDLIGKRDKRQLDSYTSPEEELAALRVYTQTRGQAGPSRHCSLSSEAATTLPPAHPPGCRWASGRSACPGRGGYLL
jgi:hypothetical protein